MYTLRWKTPGLDANKAVDIQVPVGAIVSDKASLRFTGKGAANYGVIQQENLMRLLENFADANPPLYPTVGEEWYDTANSTLKVCISVNPLIWKSLGGIQITAVNDPAPTPAAVGDIWFQRTGPLSGIMYVYTGIGRHPESYPNVGGWNQVWPQIETIAGREEYDYMLSLVNQLIGPTASGGNNALGKIVPALPNLAALDNSIRTKYIAKPDVNVVAPTAETNSELLVDTTSADWDQLLAAARYAVSRLDLPASMLDDISPVPFVSDGRPAPLNLTTLPNTDVRYPSLERRSNRRFGLVTLMRAFTETANVLSTAVANRYSLKGINGATGTNPNFDTSVEVITHAQFTGAAGGATSSSIGLKFNFASTAELDSFLNSGGAIQLTMFHNPTGSATAADTAFKNLVDSRGVVRLTADKTRVFANVFPLTLNSAPNSNGLVNSGSGKVLTTQTFGGASFTVASNQVGTVLGIVLDFSSTGPMNGTMTLRYDVIRDKTTYATPALVKVFGAPLPYGSGDKTGSSFLN